MKQRRYWAATIAFFFVVAGTAVASAATASASNQLLVSSRADRSSPIVLSGARLSGNAAIFVNHPTVSPITFYLDNKVVSTDKTAPFDFAGTDTTGAAKLFKASSLTSGKHEVAIANGGKVISRAAFQVTTPTTTTQSKCAPYPAFPNANCTGPTGTLKQWTGGDEFRTDGQVVENVEIHTAGLYVPADNVVFRNCKIVYTGGLDATFTIVNLNYNKGTRFENCELDGQGKVARAISGSGVTVKNCEIHGVGNAIETDTPLDVEENYIHDIKTADGTDWHSDGIQTGAGESNVIVKHNTIILTGPETGAINIMGDKGKPASNVLIENNLFAGGGYTMYTGPGTATYKVINNHFSTQIYPKVGYYNIWYWDPGQDGQVVRSGNVMHETGKPANTNL